MDELRPSDYLAILLRRKKLFLAVAGALFLLSFVFAARWSNYRAAATVEVAQPEVAQSLTQSAGSNPADSMESMADLHISRIQQKVLSTGSLIEIITKFNLYAKSREHTPIAAIADAMRKKIKLELVSSSLANPASAQKASADQLAAIAFVLSFDYSDPLLTQQVTNELVSRFLDEDLKERRSQAKETSDFLETQLQTLESSLAEQEKKIAAFREANGDSRPDALAFNQQAAASTEMNLQNVEGQITTNLGTQGALRAQLALTDPYSRIVGNGRDAETLTTPSAQLKALKTQYATLTAKYGPAHPDVIRVGQQVKALEAQVGATNDTAPLEAEIADIQTKLATAQKTYGPANPDVVSLQAQLKNLEAQLAEARKEPQASASSIKQDADNPAYLQIVAELKAAEEQNRSLTVQRDALRKEQLKYQKAVAQNPAAEQQLASLSRDYDNTQLRYRELKEKKMAADMSQTIEQDRSGQRLVVIDPPELPMHTQPARILFIVGGFVLALMGGFASVVGAQIVSQSVVGAHHLESLVGVAPLVTIPHIKTKDEEIRFDEKKLRLIGGAALGAIVLLIVFSYAVMPLDVLWAVLMQRLGLY
jgi:uncharacterized protein involved in exopolysaccharide biosynthesis